MHPQHLQAVLYFYFDKVTKFIKIIKLNKIIGYKMFVVDDKIPSIKRCEVSSVIITTRGSSCLVAAYTG